MEFCKKLSTKGTGKYRLPTEAEWEYACRAGTTTAYSFGEESSSLGTYAWYRDNAYNIGEQYAHEKGQKLPNGWELYDMHGNVTEWCQDWYESDYYENSPASDPSGPSNGSDRVLRGGSWGTDLVGCRSAFRNSRSPGSRNPLFGFRVIRTAE